MSDAAYSSITVNPIKLETGSRPNSAGSPYILLLRLEAIGFPTFGLLLLKGETVEHLARPREVCKHLQGRSWAPSKATQRLQNPLLKEYIYIYIHLIL